jgi:hypothetical protein
MAVGRLPRRLRLKSEYDFKTQFFSGTVLFLWIAELAVIFGLKSMPQNPMICEEVCLLLVDKNK